MAEQSAGKLGKSAYFSWSAILFLIGVAGLSAPFLYPTFFAPPLQLPHGVSELPWLIMPYILSLAWRDFEGTSRSRFFWVYLCFSLAALTCFYHGVFVDETSLFPGLTNRDVQLKLQEAVLSHSAKDIPHTYRFLPNSAVALVDWWMNNWRSSVSLYRIVFQFAVFYGLMKWSFLHLRDKRLAIIVLFFYAMLYPISVMNYAGQLTDPMSHLSFVLALYFAKAKNLRWFALTLIWGILAKESVVIMLPVYWWLNSEKKAVRLKLGALFLVLVVILVGVRLFVLGAVPTTESLGGSISGVGVSHWMLNLVGNKAAWGPGILYLLLIWVPPMIGRRGGNQSELAVIGAYMFVAIFVSSVFFSWIREYRNFIPVVFILGLSLTIYLDQLGISQQPEDSLNKHLG